uniref:Uncharacterized protein n=1 Tax=Molossus molossus TaxID=27622 RepID=A0A7J8F9Y9_MOLMO|nr:hypothetical protein HJG59_008499 [Molossus molossus]
MEADEGVRPEKGEGLQEARRHPECEASRPGKSLPGGRAASPDSGYPSGVRRVREPPLAPSRLPRSCRSGAPTAQVRTLLEGPGARCTPAPSARRNRTASAQGHRVGRPDLGPHREGGRHQ